MKYYKILLVLLMLCSFSNTVKAETLSTSYSKGYTNWSDTPTGLENEESKTFYRYSNAVEFDDNYLPARPEFYISKEQYKVSYLRFVSKTCYKDGCDINEPSHYTVTSEACNGTWTYDGCPGGIYRDLGDNDPDTINLCICHAFDDSCIHPIAYECGENKLYTTDWQDTSSTTKGEFYDIQETRTVYAQATDWSDWSEWSAQEITPTATKKVEIKTFYSYPSELANTIGDLKNQYWNTTYSTEPQSNNLKALTQMSEPAEYEINSQKTSHGVGISNFTIANDEIIMAGKTPTGTYNIDLSVYKKTISDSNLLKNITLTVTVEKAPNPISISTSDLWNDANYNVDITSHIFPLATMAQGNVTYSIESQKNSSGSQISNFYLSDSKLMMSPLTPKDIYTVILRATAVGNDNYSSGSKDCVITVNVSEYKLTLEKDGGIKEIYYTLDSDSQKTYNEPITVPVGKKVTYSYSLVKDIYNEEGYTFKEWSGTHNSSEPDIEFIMPAANVTDKLTTAPKIATYNVIYKSITGKTLGSTIISKPYNTSNIVTADEKPGYITPSNQIILWDSLKPKTIEFIYDLINYSIKYELNDGTNSSLNPYIYNTEDQIQLKKPIKVNYEFSDWYELESNTIVKSIEPGTIGDKTLYANFIPIKYKYEISDYKKGINTGKNAVVSGAYYTEKESPFIYTPAEQTCDID